MNNVEVINMDNVVTRTELIFMIALCVLWFLSWLILYLVCEYKFLICKGNCKNCKNWKCKYHAFRPKVVQDSFYGEIFCCRSCGAVLYANHDNYCTHCGYKVDWNRVPVVMDEFHEKIAKR